MKHQFTFFGRRILQRIVISSVIMLVGSAGSLLAADDHACDYLEKTEVEQETGMVVAKVEQHPANPMGQSICFFDVASDAGVRFAQLQMMRTQWAKGRFDAPALFQNNMSYLDNLREVADIGEKCYWGGSGLKMGAGLHVLVKDSYFTVMVATGDDETNYRLSLQLARLIIEKIK